MLGLGSLLKNRTYERILSRARALAAQVNAEEASVSSLSDSELAGRTSTLKEKLATGKSLDDILPEAFAVVREAAKRTLGERHYDVQLIGGAVLHLGGIAEMRTGEGKTLVATLPAYLNALAGKGVHVITVNDYLARRDAVWMGQVYASLGLSISVINHDASYIYDPSHTEADAQRDAVGSFKVVYDFLRPCSRPEAYAADITYGTNNEFGFDYLRDNLEYSAAALRQRNHAFAIVDEIDSILIDEARTPLIISAPVADAESLYTTFAKIAQDLNPGEDYTVDEKQRAVQLTDSGIEKAEKALGIENMYAEGGVKFVHHLEVAVRAKALFQKDKAYVVRDGQVVIVDEFTGRMQPGRRWSEGLHQAIEAREGVSIQQESRTYASITFQNYFRMYAKLAGMTGTALTSAEEFYSVYKLEVVPIPTNRTVARVDDDDLIFQNERGKFIAITRVVKEAHEKGQPVLIGTVSIEDNERLAAHLAQAGVPHEILNAKNHEREGEIIAQAGRRGAVTIATNMAGRGVDIKLGGAPATKESAEEVRSLGGLFVLGTERHEARRIDNQLRGRSGRQGDPGRTQFFVSLEDKLMRIFAPDMVKNMMGKLGIPEDEPIQNKLITRSLESAQEKIEGFNFDSRKHVLAYDDVLNQQRSSVYGQRRTLLTGSGADVEGILDSLILGNEQALVAAEAKKKELGEGPFIEGVRRVMLQAIDMLWVEHLETMEYLRSSVNLRAYGQRDPLVEYRKEGLRLYKEMQEALADNVGRLIPNLALAAAPKAAATRLTEGTQASLTPRPPSREHSLESKKYGRNDMVTVTDGTETRQMKYKKAEELLAGGSWKIVD